MTAPATDQAGIRQTITTLRAGGYALVRVFDGEDDVEVRTSQDAVDAILAVDDATLFVKRLDDPDGPRFWVRFVMGNDPEEVICDHHVDLADDLDELTASWWA